MRGRGRGPEALASLHRLAFYQHKADWRLYNRESSESGSGRGAGAAMRRRSPEGPAQHVARGRGRPPSTKMAAVFPPTPPRARESRRSQYEAVYGSERLDVTYSVEPHVETESGSLHEASSLRAELPNPSSPDSDISALNTGFLESGSSTEMAEDVVAGSHRQRRDLSLASLRGELQFLSGAAARRHSSLAELPPARSYAAAVAEAPRDARSAAAADLTSFNRLDHPSAVTDDPQLLFRLLSPGSARTGVRTPGRAEPGTPSDEQDTYYNSGCPENQMGYAKAFNPNTRSQNLVGYMEKCYPQSEENFLPNSAVQNPPNHLERFSSHNSTSYPDNSYIRDQGCNMENTLWTNNDLGAQLCYTNNDPGSTEQDCIPVILRDKTHRLNHDPEFSPFYTDDNPRNKTLLNDTRKQTWNFDDNLTSQRVYMDNGPINEGRYINYEPKNELSVHCPAFYPNAPTEDFTPMSEVNDPNKDAFIGTFNDTNQDEPHIFNSDTKNWFGNLRQDSFIKTEYFNPSVNNFKAIGENDGSNSLNVWLSNGCLDQNENFINTAASLPDVMYSRRPDRSDANPNVPHEPGVKTRDVWQSMKYEPSEIALNEEIKNISRPSTPYNASQSIFANKCDYVDLIDSDRYNRRAPFDDQLISDCNRSAQFQQSNLHPNGDGLNVQRSLLWDGVPGEFNSSPRRGELIRDSSRFPGPNIRKTIGDKAWHGDGNAWK